MEGFGIDNNTVKKMCIDYNCSMSDVQLECDQYINTVKTRFKNNQKDSVTQDALNHLWYQFCKLTHLYCALGFEQRKYKMSGNVANEIQAPLTEFKRCGGEIISLIDQLSKANGTSHKYVSFVEFGKWFYLDDKSIDINKIMLAALDHSNKMIESVKQYNGNDSKYLMRLMNEFEWGRTLIKNCLLPSTIYLRQIAASRILLSASKTTSAFAFRYNFIKNPLNLFAGIDMDVNALITKQCDLMEMIVTRKIPELSLDDF